MTAPVVISDALALDVAKTLCERAGVELILHGDVRREAIVLALGAWHALTGSAWDVDHARDAVSVTIPALGRALSLLKAVPVVGEVFAALGSSRPQVYLSPAALRDPVALLGTVAHELGHVARLAVGGMMWCVAYGAVPEARAADEAACYGQDCGCRVLLGGADADKACDDALASLRAYDLDEASTALAVAIVGVHRRTLRVGGIPGGPIVDVFRELRARGVEGVPEVPA